MRSDTRLKVTFVFSVVIIPTARIDFAPLPELYQQTFFPSDELNSYKPVSMISVSCTIIAVRQNLYKSSAMCVCFTLSLSLWQLNVANLWNIGLIYGKIMVSAAKLCMPSSFDKIFSKINIAVCKSCLKSLHQSFSRNLIKNIHKLELQLRN